MVVENSVVSRQTPKKVNFIYAVQHDGGGLW